MSGEQNINDFLKLLKDSVPESDDMDAKTSEEDSEYISEDILKQRLKNQYIETPQASGTSNESSEYVIDSSFLDEAVSADEMIPTDEEDASKEAEALDEDKLSEDAFDDDTVALSKEATVEEIVEDTPENTVDDALDDIAAESSENETLSSAVSDVALDGESEDNSQALEFLEDDAEIYEEAHIEDVFDEPMEEVVADAAPLEPHQTYIASIKSVGIDFSVSEEAQPVYDKIGDAEDNTFVEERIDDDSLDLSTINLIKQFCQEEELSQAIGEEQVEEFLIEEQAQIEEKVSSTAYDGNEYSDKEQNSRIMAAYKKGHRKALITLCGSALMALLTLVFELLPIFGADMSGAFDYSRYPSAYLFFGLQLVTFSVLICYKQFWSGLKRAFSLSPNRHSLVAVAVIVTAIYDVVMSIILLFTSDNLPPTFNALASITLCLSVLADYADVVAEMKTFTVYSSSLPKFTLVRERGRGSIAEKMHLGGLPEDRSVYSIRSVDFPRGFFKSQGESEGYGKQISITIIAGLFAGMIASVISILLGADAYISSSAFVLAIYVLLPIAFVYSGDLSYMIASIKLAKRGNAIAGRSMIDKYNDCDVMVFNDLHIFGKCKPEEVGIAIYDTGVGYLALGCIDALFSRIGGPLSGMQLQLPDIFKFDDVQLRRVARSGIEAIINKKHVLIVGEPSFMQRYGLRFPENEKNNGRSTLCVSLNGGITAKLSVKYEVEPVFEMLVERLYANGVSCVIQTFDPLINSKMVAASRVLGDSPISVVHLNTTDTTANTDTRYRKDIDGVLCCASRLKLAETEIWIKRLAKFNKLTKFIAAGFSCIGILALCIHVAMGSLDYINQLHILTYLICEVLAVSVAFLRLIPSNKYFTTDALYYELERKAIKANSASSKKKEG